MRVSTPASNIKNVRLSLCAILALVIISLFTGLTTQAQLSITSVGTAFNENFDGMLTSGTATLPTGFRVNGNNTAANWNTGSTATTLAYGTTGTGVVTGTSGGGTINWANGVTGSATDRALGFLTTGGYASPNHIILRITNNTGVPIASLAVSFDYEKYRSGTRAFTWTFFHGSATNPTTAETNGDQAYASDANNTTISNPPTTLSKSFTISGLNIANGADYYLKWTFTGTGGSTNGQGIGIDNFSVTATAGALAPTVSTTAASSVTTTGFSSGGNVTADGGASVTARGVAYATAPTTPTISGSFTSDGTGTGIFTSTISGLSVNTQYNYRAYATNSVNTSYGSQSAVYTLANTPGTPTLNNATSSSMDITLNGNSNPSNTEFAIQETNSGNYVQSIDGSLGASPDWKTLAQWGTPRTVTGLAASTSYTFQVKARNGDNVETGFGGTATLSTLSAGSPLITASTLTAFGNQCLNTTTGPNTFTITGSNLTAAPVTVATLNGFTYSTDDITYTSSLSITQPGGSFSQLIYVKFTPTLVQSYNGNISIGGGGTVSSYDVAASGAGINTPASVTTGSQSGITQVAASLQGSYTEGCSSVSAYGIEYSTTNGFANGSGTQVPSTNQVSGSFSSSLSGLSPNTTYYYKAYATDNAGTSYGSQQSFSTASLAAPVATAATNITTTSFDANWNAVTGADSYRLDVSTTSDFLDATATSFVQWTFPTSGTVVTADAGSNANNTTKTLTTTGGTISSVTGVTTFAASASTWQSGANTKYWQIDFDATGLYSLTLSSRQQSSNGGPRDFKLQYKVGAGAFTDVPGGSITVLNDGFTSGTVANLALPAACDNQSSVSIRWIMTSNTTVAGGTVASGGTNRIDDIIVKGKAPFMLAGYNNLTVNGLTQAVSGLNSGTTYYYRVRGFSASSTSPNSNTITAQTCAQITASAGAGGTISPSGVTTICDGSDQTYTIAADPCYSITDVLVDGVSQGAISSYTFIAVTSNHTISASFTLNTYAITVTSGSNGSITPGTGNVNCGDNATYTITPDACYSIVDVLVDGVSQGPITSYTFTNVQAAHTIDASFAINTYTITASAGANGSISPSGATTYNCGDNATYTITPDPGYLVDDVLVDGVSQGPISTYTFSNVQATHTISVSFVQAVTFTITASAGTGGTISPSGAVSVTAGNDQSFTITADPCYSITDVIVDGISQGAISTYTFTNVLATHTISATFSLNTYSITVTAGSNGSITPGTGNVNCGSNATYSITADPCYSIVDVIVDGVSQGAISTYTFTDVQTTHSISASFAINTYTITATAGANGSISPSGVTTVNCGGGQSYTITADPGFQVLDVLVNGSSVGAVTSYNFTNVQANATIDASFIAIPPTLSTTSLSAFGDVCINTTAGPNTFTINGIFLTSADVNVGPLSGFTFSTDDITYNNSLTLSQPGGTYSQLIYVKFTPTAVQSYNGSIPVNGGGFAGNADVSASGSGINTAPSVTTGSSSGVTQIAATLNGTITLNGCSAVTAYGIEYSTTNGFANGSGIQVAGGTLTLGAYSSAVSGLNANTTYYYKAYATNTGGTTYGSQQSFTTLGLDAPVAIAATNINSTSFDANWNAVTGATGYRLDVSTSSTFAGTPATLAGWSFPTTGTVVTPDVATALNTTKTLTTNGGTIGDVAGATTRAATANAWQSGSGTKFWQVDVDATGYYNLTVSSKQNSSNTGPKDFKLQYRIGAGAWTDVPSGTITVAGNFTTGVLNNLALPAACNNQSALSIRWIMTSNTSVNNGTVAAGGTNRIDDISIKGALPLYVSGYQDLAVAGTTQTVSGLTANTTYYYRVRATSTNSTSSNSNTITVSTCTPASAGTVTGSATQCIGATETYTAAGSLLSGGTGAWTSSNTAVATIDETTGLLTALSAGSTTITYTITGGCGGTVSSNLSVTVNPNANAGTVTGTATLCINTTATYTSNGDAGGSWSSSNPAVASVNPTSGLVTALSAGTTSITYTVSTGCNAPVSASQSLQVVAGGAPVVSGPTNVCPFLGNATQVTYTASSDGATSYNWNLPPNVNLISSTSNSITVTFNAGFATQANKQIRVTANSACGTSALTIYYLLVQFPGTPATITASSSDVCSVVGTPATITYTIPKVTGASSYIWTAQAGTTTIGHPNGLGANDTTITVTFSSGFSTSAITVQAVNSCGTSGTRSITVTRANPSTPSLISGPTNVCAYISPLGTAATYTVPQQPTVTTYTWTIPAGALSVTGQGTNTISFIYPAGYTGGSISVQASNGCGLSGIRSLSVATLNPATPSAIDVINTVTCEAPGPDRVYTYSLSGMPSNASSVNWTIPAAGVLQSGQGTTSITVVYPSTAVSGTVTATAVNNCGSSVSRSVDVKLAACPPEFAATGTSGQLTKVAVNQVPSSEMDVQVYPNPSTTDFRIMVETANPGQILARIMDLQGRELKRLILLPHALKTFGTDLKAGTYMVELIQGTQRSVQKLIKL